MVTAQKNGVSGLRNCHCASACVMSVLTTRNAQHNCTSVGVLRVSSTKPWASCATRRRGEISKRASTTPKMRLNTTVLNITSRESLAPCSSAFRS